MKISVITINYNNLEGLKQTIPSVQSQTYTDYEYIVVDGGSTDGSKEYIESQQGIDYWVSEKDKGIYNAMNKSIGFAHGEYCIFMNSGDHFFSAHSLAQVAPELDGTDYCIGKILVVDETNVNLVQTPQEMSLRFLVEDSLPHQSIFIKTQLLRDSPYDETYKIVADWNHFFESWYQKKKTYKAIDALVSVYYHDGFSAQNIELLLDERKRVIRHILGDTSNYPELQDPPKSPQDCHTEYLWGKLDRAMKQKPLARDWKIMRNGFKAFFKDLFL